MYALQNGCPVLMSFEDAVKTGLFRFMCLPITEVAYGCRFLRLIGKHPRVGDLLRLQETTVRREVSSDEDLSELGRRLVDAFVRFVGKPVPECLLVPDQKSMRFPVYFSKDTLEMFLEVKDGFLSVGEIEEVYEDKRLEYMEIVFKNFLEKRLEARRKRLEAPQP